MFARYPILCAVIGIALIFPVHPTYAAADLNQAVVELATHLMAVSQGKLMRVGETGLLYIEFEGSSSPAVGSAVEVVRPQAAGEESVGMAEVVQVRNNKAVAKLVDKSAMTPQVSDRVYPLQGKRGGVVVTPFTYNQTPTQFSVTLQEKLVTTLVQKGLKVVERSQLERVLQEQKLTYSGLVDLQSAKSIGKLLGAGEMVMGTLQDQGNTVAVNARLVNLETADILRATEVTLPKTPVITKELEQALEEPGIIGGAGSAAGGGSKSESKKPQQTVEVSGYTFNLQECNNSGGTTTCNMLVTSNKQDRKLEIHGGRHGDRNRIIDETGNEYLLSNAQLGSNTGLYVSNSLSTDIPTRLIVNFEQVPNHINKIKLLELEMYSKSHNTTRAKLLVKFTNIPISK